MAVTTSLGQHTWSWSYTNNNWFKIFNKIWVTLV